MDPNLFYLVFGESVINDAVGVVLFNTVAKFVGNPGGVGEWAWDFVAAVVVTIVTIVVAVIVIVTIVTIVIVIAVTVIIIVIIIVIVIVIVVLVHRVSLLW